MNEHLRSPDDFPSWKRVENATSEASTSETGKPIGIGLVEALGMTANGEVPQVSAQPAMASGTAPSAQSFCKMVVLPVVCHSHSAKVVDLCPRGVYQTEGGTHSQQAFSGFFHHSMDRWQRDTAHVSGCWLRRSLLQCLRCV